MPSKSSRKRRESWVSIRRQSSIILFPSGALLGLAAAPMLAALGLGLASFLALSIGIALALTGLAFRQVTIMGRLEPIELLSWTAVGVLLIAGVTVLASKRLELGPIDLVPSAKSSPATDLGNAIVGGLVVAVVVLAVGIAGSRIAGIRADRARRLDDINQAQLLLALAPSLAHVDLSGRDLSWMVLRKKDMRGLRARRCCFFRANLEGATLIGAELQDSDLTNCYLDQADLTGAWLDGATAKGARLSRANLDGARLFEVNLQDADLNGTTFQGAHFDDTTVWPIGFEPDSFGAHRCDSRMTCPPTPQSQGSQEPYRPLPREEPMCGELHAAEMAWIDHLRDKAEKEPKSRVRRHRPSEADLRAADLTPDPGRLYP